MTDIGPVQLIAVSFGPDAELEGDQGVITAEDFDAKKQQLLGL